MTKGELPYLGGIWITDLEQAEDMSKRSGGFVMPTLVVFFLGGLMVRVHVDFDEEDPRPEITMQTMAYVMEEDKILLSKPSDADEDPEIIELPWRYRKRRLELKDPEWWRFVAVTPDFAIDALKLPPNFFDVMKKMGDAGGFRYTPEPSVPGHPEARIGTR